MDEVLCHTVRSITLDVHFICAPSEESNMPLGQIKPTIYATMCLSHSTALSVHMKRTMDIAQGFIIDDLKITLPTIVYQRQ